MVTCVTAACRLVVGLSNSDSCLLSEHQEGPTSLTMFEMGRTECDVVAEMREVKSKGRIAKIGIQLLAHSAAS